MADEPNLELPSFFRRKKKGSAPEESAENLDTTEATSSEATDAETSPVEPATESTSPDDASSDPEISSDDTDTAATSHPAASEDSGRADESVSEPASVPEAIPEPPAPAAVERPVEEGRESTDEAAPDAEERGSAEDGPSGDSVESGSHEHVDAPASEPEPPERPHAEARTATVPLGEGNLSGVDQDSTESTPVATAAASDPEPSVVPNDEVAEEPSGSAGIETTSAAPPPLDPADDRDDATGVLPGADRDPADGAPGEKSRGLRLPPLNPIPAAALTGLLVGLLGVGIVFVLGRTCDLIIGVSSCGGTAGMLLLLATIAVMVLVGAALLRGWKLADPLSSSFLAVGLVAVFALLFLMPALFEWWMAIVIPILGVLFFLASWWITTKYAEVQVTDNAHR